MYESALRCVCLLSKSTYNMQLRFHGFVLGVWSFGFSVLVSEFNVLGSGFRVGRGADACRRSQPGVW